MDTKSLIEGTLTDYWGRLDMALEGLTSEELAWRPQANCNSIGFVAWHMARVEDRWLHYFTREEEEVWVKSDWCTQFGLAATDAGFGFTLDEVESFPTISPELLLGYLNAVRSDTQLYLQELQVQDLDVVPGRVPFQALVPLGVDKWSISRMFRQLFGELIQHLGQVSYLRGMIKGFNSQRRFSPSIE